MLKPDVAASDVQNGDHSNTTDVHQNHEVTSVNLNYYHI